MGNDTRTILTHQTANQDQPRPLWCGLTANGDLIFLSAPDASQFGSGETVVWLDAQMARETAAALTDLAESLEADD